ncbi:hypothetical protein HPB47_018241 [Ixodes persulcatus]|uniref:Uncharacterized protein n=1 Tax=Ixodes persulcatus TaxID=34615 RepID=A0AC60QNH3_IXOPE|nr:hypothetical protein HPB47_018241 [Ixodes persulcatus]
MRETFHIHDSSGRTLTAPLAHPRLRPDAVLSKFPHCPSYLSTQSTTRVDPDSKKKGQEAAAATTAIAESMETFHSEKVADTILSVKDLADNLRSTTNVGDMENTHDAESNERMDAEPDPFRVFQASVSQLSPSSRFPPLTSGPSTAPTTQWNVLPTRQK